MKCMCNNSSKPFLTVIKYVLRHFALLLSIYRRVAIGCEICYFLKDSFNCTAMSGCQILSAINYLHLISRSRRFTCVSYSACFTCYVTLTGMGVMLRVLSRLIQHVLRYLKDFCYREFSKQQFMPNNRVLFSRDCCCCCLVVVCLFVMLVVCFYIIGIKYISSATVKPCSRLYI